MSQIDTAKLAAAKSHIQANFFNVDPVIERLEMFVAMNTLMPRTGNIIFYGKGGYGKTEIVAQYLEIATGAAPFVVNMNQATTPSDIYGGNNLPALAQRGEIEYNFDNSFMNHEFAIFEEGLEPRQKVLSSLKYIISSGVFAAAGIANARPIKTKGIVIVTNIDTADFEESDDTKAFLERFPIRFKVGWEGLNQGARYTASHKVVEKFDVNRQLTDTQKRLIAENAATKLDSPRTIAGVVRAMIARQSILGGGRITDDTFTFVTQMMGYGDPGLAKRIEEERIATEIKDAKSQYEILFNRLSGNLNHYKGLRDHLDDPQYIVKVANQIKSTITLIEDIKNSVVSIRTNPDFGEKGNELASWINSQVGGFEDELEDIKRLSYDGVVLTLANMIEKAEAE